MDPIDRPPGIPKYCPFKCVSRTGKVLLPTVLIMDKSRSISKVLIYVCAECSFKISAKRLHK